MDYAGSTEAEVRAAGKWLAKRGVEVDEPTTLLALRLGARAGARPPGYWRWAILLMVVAVAGTFALGFLPHALGLHYSDMPEGRTFFALYATMVVGFRLAVRGADRRAAAHLAGRGIHRPRPAWRAALCGWNVAAMVVTFGGGAVLAVVMAVTTSKPIWALSWLALLALGAIVVAVIVTDVLRSPVIAEDEASLAVDSLLRRDDQFLALPALFAYPAVFDPLLSGGQPREFTPWLAGYFALAVATQAIGFAVQYRHRKLPAGDYGTLAAAR
ncbi:hypothetical protein VA596_03720 [Amycolatopsis sp., V23-08]|uniref:ABC transporter permease n=1 Tax=Amycolatopsis heterodermiae TaxID=3110235 RepID=A0ABU5QXH2_9PSEU|nr:hypothetical protein [Amycolatopsis sp., V23-08]MEA5358632.1 hypothetical protein [Amycolatopsis sp., V23-08]